MYLICYDIADSKRLYRMARLLKGYGVRVQESVFECHLTEQQRAEMISRIEQTIDPTRDNVRCYPIERQLHRQIRLDGSNVTTEDWKFLDV